MNFKIDRAEVFRYLHLPKKISDNNINNLIEEAITEIKDLISFRYLYQKFPVEITDSAVKVDGTTLILKGKSIRKHLNNSEEIYIMAATLGAQVDRKISYYEKTSVTKAMIFDACATAAIEEACDRIEAEIKKEVSKSGNKEITFRYSPGYGDLGIDIQGEILRILNAPRKIGLTASKYNLLFPTKSVTAIIGIIPKNQKREKKKEFLNADKKDDKMEAGNLEFEKNQCQKCLIYQDCELRRKGIYCGAKR